MIIISGYALLRIKPFRTDLSVLCRARNYQFLFSQNFGTRPIAHLRIKGDVEVVWQVFSWEGRADIGPLRGFGAVGWPSAAVRLFFIIRFCRPCAAGETPVPARNNWRILQVKVNEFGASHGAGYPHTVGMGESPPLLLRLVRGPIVCKYRAGAVIDCDFYVIDNALAREADVIVMAVLVNFAFYTLAVLAQVALALRVRALRLRPGLADARLAVARVAVSILRATSRCRRRWRWVDGQRRCLALLVPVKILCAHRERSRSFRSRRAAQHAIHVQRNPEWRETCAGTKRE